MRKSFVLALCLLVAVALIAQPAAYTPTEIMLLGTFHFDNPGLDVAKFEDADVLNAKRQKEIKSVVDDLKRFKPDVIFIEATPAMQPHFDSLFTAYTKKNLALPANEVYQLGFRLAKELNHANLQCVDYRDASFPFDSLVKVMTSAKQTNLLTFMKNTIDSIERLHNDQLKRMTIKQMLVQGNTLEQRHFSIAMYFQFLKAGDLQNHIGSFLASEWWRRNMVIYENILKRLTGKEKRVLVLFGSAHTALLHDFIKYDPFFKIVDVATYLR